MNEQLKKAILKTIEYSTVERIFSLSTSYLFATPDFTLYVARTEIQNKFQNSSSYEYTVQLGRTVLLSEYISATSASRTVGQRDALEIWHAAENKYIRQQQLNKEEQAALKLMENYIAQQKQDKTR